MLEGGEDSSVPMFKATTTADMQGEPPRELEYNMRNF